MKPGLRPILTWTVILATIIRFQTIRSQESPPYDVCSQLIKCGNTALDYPFWGLHRPAYCGAHSGFQITCPFNVPLLRSESLTYRILQIDTRLQTITIARDDLWTNHCPQYLYNTTYDLTLFKDDNFGQENVSLYYGCDSAEEIMFDSNAKLNCNVNGTKNNNYFIRTILIDDMISNFAQCNTHITVPVNRSLANRLELKTATVDDLRPVLNAGFNLQWALF